MLTARVGHDLFMPLPFVRIDAFTTEAFAGNPAAVCVLPDDRDVAWMQAVAREMNAGATAFLRKREDGYDLRWFAPTTELRLCGHGTLASAHALWEGGHLMPSSPACFHTPDGVLTAVRRDDPSTSLGAGPSTSLRANPSTPPRAGLIGLDFPAPPGPAVES